MGSGAGAAGSLLTNGANATATVVSAVGTSVGTILGSTPSVAVTPHSGSASANNPLAPVTSLISTLSSGLRK